MTTDYLLSVKDLSIHLLSEGRLLPILSNIYFDIQKGETFSLVGESGCGKSITSLALTKLLPSNIASYPSGSVIFENQNLLQISESSLRSIRGNDISYVFQEPFSSLNPLHKIGDQLIEGFLLHGLGSKEEAEKKQSISWREWASQMLLCESNNIQTNFQVECSSVFVSPWH